ncbi:Hypothetical protein FKW44_017189 [Caligus rogercresseyi]|uniref:Uncharacterized protein n=1 Tax=Caligus rogercresseyi TaxID=217165 RepID=A0A7T8H3L7_CALRO|nr:Hypothetical protein FKW44_017189 [Caligus rogercresseyi]
MISCHWRPRPPDHHRCRLLHPVDVSGILWDLGGILEQYTIILRIELLCGLEKFLIKKITTTLGLLRTI